MTHEIGAATPEPGVLSYATPAKPAEWLPPPAWLRRAVAAAALPVLALFLLGLPPLSGRLDYTRTIGLAEAVEYARTRGVRGTLDNATMVGVAMFAPTAVAGLVAFLRVRGVVPQRVVIAANVVLPVAWLGPFWPVLAVAGPFLLCAAAAGRCDGEDWSEGLVCYAAAGSWTTLWLAAALVLAGLKRRRSKRTAARATA